MGTRTLPPQAPPCQSEPYRKIRSATGTPATVAMFATDTAEISHVPTVPTYGQPTLASDLPPLLRTHRREAPAALLLPAAAAAGRAPRAHAIAGPSSLG